MVMNPTASLAPPTTDEEIRADIELLIEQIKQMSARTKVVQQHTEESQQQTRVRLETLREMLRR